MEQMVQFLTKRAQVLESLHTNTNKTTQLKSTNPQLKSRTTEQSVSCITTTPCCSYCQKSQHALYKCYKFIGLPVKTRIEEAIRMRVCFNCLRTGHRATECHSSTCQTCQRRHNTLLHQDEVKPRDKSAVASAEKRSTEGKPGTDGHSVTLTCNINHNQIVLPTALVKVFDTNNTCYIVRALLDTGSQSNFITNELCDKLKPNLSKSNVTISGLNQIVSKISARCDIMIKSLNESFSTNITCLVVSQITNNMPLPAIQSSRVQIPPKLELADPSLNETKDIDMLLGAATFFDVLCKDRITYGRNQPVLQNTLLGWIVAGTVTSSQSRYTDSTNLLCITEDQLQKGMERFWEIEETSTAENYSKDERDCETHFAQTFKRAEDGRFILEMPLRNTIDQLGETRDIALKRIESVERRFKKSSQLKEGYVQFMREYEELGHMTSCNESSQEALYYLPHHPVLKEDSLTTKLRVVFDASAQPVNGLSLNQVQLVGPTIQNDLYSIVVRFRTHDIVLTADVEKMYRQVWIAESQRRLQCILWRSESEAPVKSYKLNTITYGTAAAPFMAIRCLAQLALENKERYPAASDTVKNDFYVDDLLTGARNVDEALQLYTEVSTILQQAQFKLRKWTSNNAEVLNKISHATIADTNIVYVCENSATKTLGIHWNPMQDVFQYTVNISEKQCQMTKRVVLSIISQIYDPLGLLSPIIIIAKIFMQKLWQSHLGWDEPLTGILYTEWCSFKQSMQQVTQITHTRHHLTQLIFRAKHIKLFHAGPQLLLSHIREQFWPVGGRNLARKIVRRCVTCFRSHPKHLHAIMGNLPADRVKISYPFYATGVDYAGPFMLRDRKGRNFKIVKSYICLFVCFVTKAIHLELVSELTTEAFIMTLRRFTARRGNSAHIYSDNGTNFVGANNKLKELNDFLQTYESKLKELCTQERITWYFIPANSPHFGGLWEAGVKSTKYHLRRVLGNVKLTFEEFYTTIVQIESILNSRPLSPLSQDPNDPTPLTPSHFLVGRPLTTVADPNLQSLPETRLSLYQRMQQLCQHFWSRWSKEYVSELQQRQRWKNNQRNVAVGTVVVIKDDHLPPLCWLLGKIEEVHPGDDGVIRVVSVKTSKGIIKKAISKICPLPADDSVVQVQVQ